MAELQILPRFTMETEDKYIVPPPGCRVMSLSKTHLLASLLVHTQEAGASSQNGGSRGATRPVSQLGNEASLLWKRVVKYSVLFCSILLYMCRQLESEFARLICINQQERLSSGQYVCEETNSILRRYLRYRQQL